MGWFGYSGQANNCLWAYAMCNHWEITDCACPADGQITKFKTNFANSVGTVKLTMLRRKAGTEDYFYFVGESQAVTCEDGEQEYVLTTPINVLEGDVIGICLSVEEPIRACYYRDNPALGSRVEHRSTNYPCPSVIMEEYQYMYGALNRRVCVQAYLDEGNGNGNGNGVKDSPQVMDGLILID